MIAPFINKLLLVTALLVVLMSCSKKQDASPAANTGSFQLDGTPVVSNAKATRSAGSIGSSRYDFINLELTTSTKEADKVRQINLLLYKVPGASDATCALHSISVYTGGNGSPYNFAPTDFKLTADEEGSFSGSFAGRVSVSSSSISGPYTTIANGVFTKVRF
jgi:hypothetical protein